MMTGWVSVTQAQEKQPGTYRHALYVISDNDVYLAQANDRYYTNGIFFGYSWAGRQGAEVKKQHTLVLGQLMFNPRDYSLEPESSIDRPYAGFLFLTYQQALFLKKDQVLQLSATAGTTGKPSLAEALQRWYHRTVGFDKPEGWKYQVKTEPGINVSALYAATLFPGQAQSSVLAVKPVVQVTAGNSFTGTQAGVIFQLGAFEANGESALWNAGLNRTPAARRRKYECFVYFHPQLTAQVYNATIQGGLFRQDKGTVRDPERLVYQQTLGFMYARNHVSLGLAFTFQTKETTVQQLDQRYGTIQFGYKFN